MAIEGETALAQVPLVVHFSLPPFCYLQHPTQKSLNQP